ncbi:hypothetical protein GCM10028777_04110 [Angustibacter speluncae]
MSTVSAEMLKLSTTKAWWGMLIGLAAWATLWSLPNAFTAGLEFAPGATAPAPADDDAIARSFYTIGLGSFGYVFALVLGVLVISSEYRHKTITTTILGTPHRPRIVLAKWVVTAAYALLYGVVGLGLGVAVTALILSLRGIDLNLGADGLVRALALALVAFVLWGLIGVGVGTLVGNQIVAILVGIGFIVAETIASVALSFVSWGPDLVKWLPSSATSAMLQPTTDTGPGGPEIQVLTWWVGLLVLLGYALVTAGVGALLQLRRDVT